MMVQKLSQSVWGVLVVLLFVLAGRVVASPYFAITGDMWQDALDHNQIAGIDANDYNDVSWIVHDPNESYPYNVVFRTPTLYVYSPPGQIATSSDWAVRFDINADGIVNFADFVHFADKWLHSSYDYSFLGGKSLIMAWGDLPEDPNTVVVSGWQFKYSYDPDLTNATMTIAITTVDNITGVAFGLQDNNKKKIIWRWDVGNPPKPIPYGQPTRITINTAKSGVGAATPTATSFTSDPGFNITQVVSMLFDEHGRSLNTIAVPAPGKSAKLWNSWKDLIIVPNPPLPPPLPPTPVYYKWRQPAQFVGNQSYYWGWDEISIEANEPNEWFLADDWCCTDNRPITDVHWWGSFPNRDPNKPGWMASQPPPFLLKPRAFHIGIWTDSPSDPNGQDLTKYSHPNEMVFSQYCYNYDVNFVGYDRNPHEPNHPVKDACFKFSCDLDPSFTQDPNANRIYWLSIAAVYDQNFPDPNYVWGWKTRPHYYNDDAVWIDYIVGGGWPPAQGSRYESGAPLECPEYCSWDLTFELTTDQNDTDGCDCFRR